MLNITKYFIVSTFKVFFSHIYIHTFISIIRNMNDIHQLNFKNTKHKRYSEKNSNINKL